ncbi:MAG TPA: transcription antitermination factor NusB [Bacilli bacterium]|nr:transcription antitermination factor NusB [Bacilli bacterium]
MKYSRNKTQDQAMILIYNVLTYMYIDQEFDIEKLISDYLYLPYDEVDIFIKEAVIKSIINREGIINELQASMTNWKLDRINRLAQAILLLAVTHYRYIEKIDKSIVIDNAVRLAKKYLDEGDYRLINAVLDATL